MMESLRKMCCPSEQDLIDDRIKDAIREEKRRQKNLLKLLLLGWFAFKFRLYNRDAMIRVFVNLAVVIGMVSYT